MFAHVNDGVERPKVARKTAFRNPGFPAISAEASSVRMQGSTKTYSKDDRAQANNGFFNISSTWVLEWEGQDSLKVAFVDDWAFPSQQKRAWNIKKGPRAKVINCLGLNQLLNKMWGRLECKPRMILGPRRFACKQRLIPVSKMIQSKQIYHNWLSITSEKFALIFTRVMRYQMARNTVFRESWMIEHFG